MYIQNTNNIRQVNVTSLQTAYARQSFIAGVYAEGFPVYVAGKFRQASQQQLLLVARGIFWRITTNTHHKHVFISEGVLTSHINIRSRFRPIYLFYSINKYNKRSKQFD